MRMLPVSAIWSSPPTRQSSSLNHSPARLEVNDNKDSMARYSLCKIQNTQVQQFYKVKLFGNRGPLPKSKHLRTVQNSLPVVQLSRLILESTAVSFDK